MWQDSKVEPAFKVGDKVICTTPTIVCEECKGVVGEVVEIKGYTDPKEFSYRIWYPDGLSQIGYYTLDGMVLAKDIKEAPKGKVASDGGPSDYYDFPEGCSTLNDLIEYKGMSFAQGNIFKAAYRLGNKEGITLEYDLNKIKYYADRMLAQLDSERN